MTEQNPPEIFPEPPSDDDVDQAGVETREPAEAPKFDVPAGTKDSGRYAFYDTTLGRYVGGTHDARKAAKEAGKGAASGEVVEV